MQTGGTKRGVRAAMTLLALFVALGASAGAHRMQAITPQYTEAGTESCIRCHGGEKITVIAETAHGDASNPHSPYAQQGCEACHGPGSLHVSRARGGAGFPALLKFGDRATRAEQKQACLSCHAQALGELEGMAFAGSLHDTSRITCGTCHQVHSTARPLASRDGQTANCARCHEQQVQDHPTFADKGISFDKLSCADCHDVHQLQRKQ